MDYASSILGFLPGGRRSTGISQLLDKLETYLPPAQIERVREAYEFGAERHQGQKRVSGEPYITHPVAVADILADLRLDGDTLDTFRAAGYEGQSITLCPSLDLVVVRLGKTPLERKANLVPWRMAMVQAFADAR